MTSSMRVTHVSTTDNRGGGARSAYRLHTALRDLGVDSRMFVKNKVSDDPWVSKFQPSNGVFKELRFKLRRRLETGSRGYFTPGDNAYNGFSPATGPLGLAPLAQLPESDIVNLHWVSGFFDIRMLPRLTQLSRAVVWRPSDMNPFTGGCFYDNSCGRFKQQCGHCPCIQSTRRNDISRRSLQLKHRLVKSLPEGFLHIVAQSRWIESQIRESTILGDIPVTRIPNGIDSRRFKPMDKLAARSVLGLPEDHGVVMFTAQSVANPRKGGAAFVEAINSLSVALDRPLTVLALGADRLSGLEGVNLMQMEVASETLLMEAYSAADVFVITSAQDNLPNTVLEAMACAIPVVGFSAGGVPDMVLHGKTGFLATLGNTEELAQRIRVVLTDEQIHSCFSVNGRDRVKEQFDLNMQAQAYSNLYQSLLAARSLQSSC